MEICCYFYHSLGLSVLKMMHRHVLESYLRMFVPQFVSERSEDAQRRESYLRMFVPQFGFERRSRDGGHDKQMAGWLTDNLTMNPLYFCI